MNAAIIASLMFYGAFLLGEFFFLLKRANLAAQSPAHDTTVGKFMWSNKWTILGRWFCAFFIFWIVQHFGFTKISALLGWTLPFNIDPGVVPFLAIGYMSDSLLDWLQAKPWMPAIVKDAIPPSNYQLMAMPNDAVGAAKDLGGKTVAPDPRSKTAAPATPGAQGRA